MVGAVVMMSGAAAEVEATAACLANASPPALEGPTAALDCCALRTSSVKLIIWRRTNQGLIRGRLVI